VVAIVASNLMDSAYPKFPLPLAQIGFGVLIALTPFDMKLTIDPELFMGILIAPILFRESEEADILALWRIRKTVLFMVFGLVFVTVFVIGFSVHSLVPTIPLAACFCLGAALGPTDAIAVSSVSGRVEIGDRIMNILKGEFLINDASGVISFNFAAIALVTGSFSLIDASREFLILCAGGLAIGLAISFVKALSLKFLNRASRRNSAAFMLIELLTPLLCFFVAEKLGFSGILAAVIAGCRQALSVRRLEKFEAEFATLKKSVWGMITMVFNSFIFILLGLSLPTIIETVIRVDDYSLGFSALVGLFATFVLYAVRFVGVFIGARGMKEKNGKERLRNLAILTLSGVKGTVSLATAFSLPYALYGGKLFEHRSFLLFVVACVIIYSLIISTVFLPIIARTKRPRRRKSVHARIIRDVIGMVGDPDSACAKAVVMTLNRRAMQLEYDAPEDDQKKMTESIQREFVTREVIDEYDREIKRCFYLERQKLDEYIADGRVDEEEADEIRVQINTLENYAIRNVQSDAALRLYIMKKKRKRLTPRKKK
jgi:CPA1 family monovalent cation:H+ antiporter